MQKINKSRMMYGFLGNSKKIPEIFETFIPLNVIIMFETQCFLLFKSTCIMKSIRDLIGERNDSSYAIR